MANPEPNIGNRSVPKLIQNTRYKIRKDVLDTTQEIIPSITVLPSLQDRVLHFKVPYIFSFTRKKVEQYDDFAD